MSQHDHDARPRDDVLDGLGGSTPARVPGIAVVCDELSLG